MEASAKNYIAFFDLDRTIISLNSGSMLVRQAYKKRLMTSGNLINAILQYYLYKFNLRDTNLIITNMGGWLKGIPAADIEQLSQEVFDKYLRNSIRPEIIKEIDLHKNQNARTVILSSAISFVCKPVAVHLGIDDLICTTMETEAGILTGRPVGNFCFEDEKRIRLLSYCEKYHCDNADAWYYADSIADLPVLEVVGHPLCVSPDRKLERIANTRRWNIHYW